MGYGTMKNRRFLFYSILIAIPVVLLLAETVLHYRWPHWRWENAPLHSTAEALGALVATFMALILLQRVRSSSGKFFLLAMGFLGMGLLDGFHAATWPGEEFVFLRSLAGLVAGFFFALAWLPGFGSRLSEKEWIPWAVAAGSMLCGLWALLLPGTLPVMVHNGEFTPAAININILAGALFLAAAFRFALDFHRSGSVETYLFACMSLLFAVSGLTFQYSSIWNNGWWSWHLLRLITFLLVLGFMIRQYLQVVSDLKLTIAERRLVEEALQGSEKKLKMRNRIANIFLTTTDDKMYGEILGVALEAMKSKYGVFGYIDENGALTCPSMTRDIWDQCQIPDKDIVFPRDTWGGIWGRALIEKTARYSNEPFKVPEGHVPVTRALDVPIIYQGEVIGNLLVGNKETNYVERDQELLEEISGYIAPVLSARLQRDKEEKDRRSAEKDLRKSEEKLARSEKMEAMGLMAGGVAHDLNNILSGIVSYPELLLLDLPEGSPLREPIKTIQESGMRAADVVEDLLTIARGVATGNEALNLNAMVEEYISSAEHQKLEKIHPLSTFKTDLDSELLNITGSASHVKKVLMNLIVNASEAIEGKGTVTVSTMNRYLDEPLKGYEDVRIGEYVLLSISDDGSGISPQDLDRVFEPFYTKKVMGRSGTGLGLAVVWNSMLDHNGYINVKSSEKGTVFELYFPTTREEVAAEEEEIPVAEYQGHGEKILVVDDEERQREIANGILTRLGYNAETVSSGEEAIEYVKEHPVDLILLDMVMPKGINGRKTYEEIIKIRPGQKAIIATGYAKTKEVDRAQDLGAGKYIKKPYTLGKVDAIAASNPSPMANSSRSPPGRPSNSMPTGNPASPVPIGMVSPGAPQTPVAALFRM